MIPCFACGGPYHPATGHVWLPWMVVYCGPCIRSFYAWARQHMRPWRARKGEEPRDFYKAAATSVRAK